MKDLFTLKMLIMAMVCLVMPFGLIYLFPTVSWPTGIVSGAINAAIVAIIVDDWNERRRQRKQIKKMSDRLNQIKFEQK